MAKKKASEITLAEHVARIGKLGGKARALNLSEEELSAIGRKGGEAGGAARAKKLTRAQRSAIAKKAAAARWGKK
jgi:general stress protein YciG